MSHSAEIALGIIAAATAITALVQVGVIVAAGLLARRISRLAQDVQRELKPIVDHVNAITLDASRATALATAQVERVDHLFADVARRVEATMNTVQQSLAGSAREGRAVLSALKAAFGAIRDMREARARQGRGEDEEALFI